MKKTIKNSVDELNIRLNTAKEGINELVDTWINEIKYSLQRQGDGIYDKIKIRRHRECNENV